MRRKVSKLLSMLLASVMVLCMALTGFAAEIEPYSSSTDDKFSVTINNAADGETYSAYKIFDVTYSDADSEGNVSYYYTIDSDSDWYSVVSVATDVFTLTPVGDSDSTTYSVAVKDGVEDDAIIKVFTDAVTAIYVETEEDGVTVVTKVLYIGDKQLAADASEVAANGTAVIDVTESGPGYYFVSTTLGSLVTIDTTDPNPEIEEKNGIPTVSKWVHENTDPDDTWGHEDDASNNENILFEIEIDNINGAVNLVLHDSMDSELYIPNEANFHLNSIYLYTSEDAEPIALTEGIYDEDSGESTGDYYITVGECTVDGCTLDNCAFEIHFLRSFDDVDAAGYIELTYSLLLNEEGAVFSGDYEEIDNYAQVTFATTSFSAEVYAETYSFGFEVYKYTEDTVYREGVGDVTTRTPIAGVEFELRNSVTDDEGVTTSGDNIAYFLKETLTLEDDSTKTIYLFEGWADSEDEVPEDYTTTLVSGSDGMIYIDGLDTGTYYLYETRADGYNMLTGPVTVEIWATYDDESGAMTDHGVSYTYNGVEGTGIVNIQNNAGSALPSTGGMGTTLFYIVGIVLVLGAAVLFVTKKRLDRE